MLDLIQLESGKSRGQRVRGGRGRRPGRPPLRAAGGPVPRPAARPAAAARAHLGPGAAPPGRSRRRRSRRSTTRSRSRSATRCPRSSPATRCCSSRTAGPSSPRCGASSCSRRPGCHPGSCRSSSVTVPRWAARWWAPSTTCASPGPPATGREVAAAAGRRLVGVTLELGGKNPLYVADDVDVEVAAEGAVRACFSGTGQLCVSVERVYVHDRGRGRVHRRVRAADPGADPRGGPGLHRRRRLARPPPPSSTA